MKRPEVVLFLLVLSIAINYIDRGALSVSAPLLTKELQIEPAQLGLLLSAFFWTYALVQLGAGWLVDRYDVKWIFSASYLVWCLSTLATGFVTGFNQLFAARLSLGAGESVTYPAYSRILVRTFPENRLGMANSLIDVGSKLGPAMSTLLGGLLVNRLGWRALFIAIGAASLLWLIPWLIFAPKEDPKPAADGARASVPFGELLRNRQVISTSVGMFTLGYVWYFLLTWLPSYLVRERGFSLNEMAVLGSVPFFFMAATTTFCGWYSDKLIREGAAATKVRRSFCVAGLLGCGALLLPAAMVSEPKTSVALITLACCSLGVYTSNVWAITQTLAGPAAAGKWSGIQNAVGNLGGVASPIITGFIVAKLGSFWWAFAAASGVITAGALCYFLYLGELKPVRWQATAG